MSSRNQTPARGSKLTALAVVVIGLVVILTCGATESARPLFRAALDAHLAAIANRDLAAFKDTLTSNGDLYVIFPDGEPLVTTSAVIDFHKKWFADPKWVFEPTVVKIIEGRDMATALLKYRYRDSAESEPRESWLVLVFRLEGRKWRLVHDQNTRIAK